MTVELSKDEKAVTTTTNTIVHKHYYETPSVAAVIIALVVAAVYCQTHGASEMAGGFTTCALLLGFFKFV